MAVKDVFKELGKDILRTAFPEIYSAVAKYRQIAASRPKKPVNPFHESPLIREITKLANAVQDANEIATDSLEAQLVTNEILSRIEKRGALGGGKHGGIAEELGVGPTIFGKVRRKPKVKGKGSPEEKLKGAAEEKTPRIKGGKIFGRFGKIGRIFGKAANKLAFIGPLLEGLEEYTESGDAAKAVTVGGGAAAGGYAGMALGAIIGSALIPIPGVGTVVGSLAGSAIGAWLGSSLAREGYDVVTAPSTKSTPKDAIIPHEGHSLETGSLYYIAENSITLKADEIIIAGLEIEGLLPKNLVPRDPRGSAIQAGQGSMPIYRPGIGGNETQRAAREPYIPRRQDGSPSQQRPSSKTNEPAISTNGKEVPPETLEQARQLLEQGGNSGDLNRWMAAQGYPMQGNWCGEFAADVVKSIGGTPPRNPQIASNWLQYGQHVDPKDVKPGDIAVRTNQGTLHPGELGGHVGFVYGRDERGNFKMIGGNQGRPISGNQSMGGYEFRRAEPAEETPNAEASAPQTQSQAKTSSEPAVPTQTNSSDRSYTVDMQKVLAKVRETYHVPQMLYSDDQLKERMGQEFAKNWPNVKFEGNKITGKQSEIDRMETAMQSQYGIDASQYFKPIPIPMPDPSVARIRADRDRYKKALKRERNKQKEARDNHPDEKAKDGDDKNNVPPPKDNTRSDRALWTINPQLHKDNHPQ